MSNWHKTDIAEVALAFGTDTVNGKINVVKDRKRRGDNNIFLLPSADSKSVLKKMTSDASIAILSVVYILTAMMGRYVESVLGIFFLLLAFYISYVSKNASSNRIINSYRLLLPGASVIENGQRIRLSVFDVEVGDLIEFSQGDIIPADARVVSAVNLTVAERYIDPVTGKVSYKREDKTPDTVYSQENSQDTYSNILYAASMVVSGRGSAIITETGMDTKFSDNSSGMRIVSNDDIPDYFSYFLKSARRISLLACISVIPLTFFALIYNSFTSKANNFDLIYLFQLLLAVAVTCMSEIIIMPTETLLTKELLVSSRKRKANHNFESRVTKLNAAESIADTDTVLILSTGTLIDHQHSVRRIYFSDKNYRFDALKSVDLDSFWSEISPVFLYSGNNWSKDLKAIKDYANRENCLKNNDHVSDKPFFLKNYPFSGARACVYERDAGGEPLRYKFYTDNADVIEKCSLFRTEGGGLWRVDSKLSENIYSAYDAYKRAGLSVVVFLSSCESANETYIFDGMVGVGIEYPFANGNLAEELDLSGIQPILFLGKESADEIYFALNCGLINSAEEIVLKSDYKNNGLRITDAPITTKAYIGFGRNEINELTNRLINNGRKVLPIIRDSSDRRGISPISVYAICSSDSYDSIKIASSLSLKQADAVEGKGGVFDSLKIIRGCCMARLKLGVFKNYLAFTAFLRIVAICCSLLVGKSGANLTSILIMSTGFLFDAVALVSLINAKGIPVKPKEAASDAKVLFSPTLLLFFSIAGALSGLVAFFITELLMNMSYLQPDVASLFLINSLYASQIAALGAFLIILNKRSRRLSINFAYIAFVSLFALLLVVQNFMPEIFFNLLAFIQIYRIDLALLPFVFLVSSISAIVILMISKLLWTFSDSHFK